MSLAVVFSGWPEAERRVAAAEGRMARAWGALWGSLPVRGLRWLWGFAMGQGWPAWMALPARGVWLVGGTAAAWKAATGEQWAFVERALVAAAPGALPGVWLDVVRGDVLRPLGFLAATGFVVSAAFIHARLPARLVASAVVTAGVTAAAAAGLWATLHALYGTDLARPEALLALERAWAAGSPINWSAVGWALGWSVVWAIVLAGALRRSTRVVQALSRAGRALAWYCFRLVVLAGIVGGVALLVSDSARESAERLRAGHIPEVHDLVPGPWASAVPEPVAWPLLALIAALALASCSTLALILGFLLDRVARGLARAHNALKEEPAQALRVVSDEELVSDLTAGMQDLRDEIANLKAEITALREEDRALADQVQAGAPAPEGEAEPAQAAQAAQAGEEEPPFEPPGQAGHMPSPHSARTTQAAPPEAPDPLLEDPNAADPLLGGGEAAAPAPTAAPPPAGPGTTPEPDVSFPPPATGAPGTDAAPTPAPGTGAEEPAPSLKDQLAARTRAAAARAAMDADATLGDVGGDGAEPPAGEQDEEPEPVEDGFGETVSPEDMLDELDQDEEDGEEGQQEETAPSGAAGEEDAPEAPAGEQTRGRDEPWEPGEEDKRQLTERELQDAEADFAAEGLVLREHMTEDEARNTYTEEEYFDPGDGDTETDLDRMNFDTHQRREEDEAMAAACGMFAPGAEPALPEHTSGSEPQTTRATDRPKQEHAPVEQDLWANAMVGHVDEPAGPVPGEAQAQAPETGAQTQAQDAQPVGTETPALQSTAPRADGSPGGPASQPPVEEPSPEDPDWQKASRTAPAALRALPPLQDPASIWEAPAIGDSPSPSPEQRWRALLEHVSANYNTARYARAAPEYMDPLVDTLAQMVVGLDLKAVVDMGIHDPRRRANFPVFGSLCQRSAFGRLDLDRLPRDAADAAARLRQDIAAWRVMEPPSG